jgi:hypothetical protein
MKGIDILDPLHITRSLASSGAMGLVPKALSDSFEKEKQEKEKAAQANMMSGSPGMAPGMKRGGAVKKMAKGGSASSRADGCAAKGKTKGRFV